MLSDKFFFNNMCVVMQEMTVSCHLLEWQIKVFEKYITVSVSGELLFGIQWLSKTVHTQKKTVYVYSTHEPLQQLQQCIYA